MKRKIICIGIISIFLLSGLSLNAAGINQKNITAKGNTLYVDDDGGADFTNIQDAVDAASDGDVIYVYSGTYYENIVVDKSITLKGEDKTSTVIDGGDNENKAVISVQEDSVKVSNFKIQNGKYGIEIDKYPDVAVDITIINNFISENRKSGISLFNCRDIDIADNLINKNGEHGIFAKECWLIIIDENVIEYNYLDGITNMIKEGNSNWCDFIQNIISNNNIRENHERGIDIWGKQNEICFNNIVEHAHDETNVGIKISGDENIIKGNLIEDNYLGLSLAEAIGDWEGPMNNEVYHNNFVDNIDHINAINVGDNIFNKDYENEGCGNYWSGYDGGDSKKGPEQNLIGSDGIGDTPINGDNYPWMNPNGEGVNNKVVSTPVIDFIENMLDNFDWPFPMLRVMLWALGK